MNKEDVSFWEGVSMGLALGKEELEKLLQKKDGTFNEALLEGINAINEQEAATSKLKVKEVKSYLRANLP